MSAPGLRPMNHNRPTKTAKPTLICSRCGLSAEKAEASGCGQPGCARELSIEVRNPRCGDCGLRKVLIPNNDGEYKWSCNCRPY